MEESTTQFWINKIIEDSKKQERERIIKILKNTPNLEENYNILMVAICVEDVA